MLRRRIIWTSSADILFTAILHFYAERNGNTKFSKKLIADIQKTARLLAKYPYLGKRTDIADVYVVVNKNLKIFYSVGFDSILILLIRDCRQREDDV